MSKKLVILYGSQTGNAQDLAERIWRKSKQYEISTLLSSFDKFKLENLANNDSIILLGVCSTTGQGDVPDNMSLFWKRIMHKNVPSNCLSNLQFATIGLGDSSYEKYNFTAKKLYKRLIQLGAQPIVELCLCDEQQSDGIEGTYSRWIINFWPSIQNEVNFVSNKTKNELIISKYRLVYLDDSASSKQTNSESDELNQNELKPANELYPYQARLVNNQRVTADDHWQDVRLIELECNTNRIKYEAGDVLMLRPSNFKENIQKFNEIFQHLNLNANQRIRIESNYKDELETSDETSPTLIQTVGDLIEKYFDFNSVPRMSFFEIFAEIAQDDLEKEKLKEFQSGEGLEDLYNYCYRPRRTIIEIFYDFPKTSQNIKTLDQLLELIPAIKPRSFSIASSPFVHKNIIQLLVAIVEYKTRLYETRKGTCSYWLSTLKPAELNIKIPVWIKKGSFNFNWNKPLLCIGPGTGIAPFRSILYERIKRFDLNNNHLYFGCRSKLKDFYFEKEWKQLDADLAGYLFLNVAFSRDQPEKIYVQDLLIKNSEIVFNLLENSDAYVLIAGNSKRMPQDIMAILEKIIKENLSKSNNNDSIVQENLNDFESLAKNYMKNLQAKGRIQMETWS